MRITRTAALASAFAAALAGSAHAQLRVVTYNTATGGSTAFNNRQTFLQDVLTYIGLEQVNGITRAPDLLILQEQRTSGGVQDFANLMNQITGTNDYAAWTQNPFNSDGLQTGFVYNTDALEVVHEDWLRTDTTRSTARIAVRPVGYGDDASLWVYNTHFKAGTSSGDQTRRRDAALDQRISGAQGQVDGGGSSGVAFGSDNLAPDANIIYAGDFNQRSSNEDANGSFPTFVENPYAIFLEGPGDSGVFGAGEAVDPINAPGSWNSNLAFAPIHTQSPHDGSQGLVTGGIDDRFDMQLISTELNDGEGLHFIAPGAGDTPAAESSYRVFGNNGTAFNQAANTASNTALDWIISDLGQSTADRNRVRDAVAKASDHLPVVLDLALPARMAVAVDAPPRVIAGAAASVGLLVTNDAPVALAVAADELNYSGGGSGALSAGAFVGTVAAAGAGNPHTLPIDTGTAGVASGAVTVNASSAAAANAAFAQNVSIDVLDPAQASFAAGLDLDTLTLDFGTLAPGAGPAVLSGQVLNLIQTPGFTAGLDIDSITVTGDTGVFSLDLLPTTDPIAAGDGVVFEAILDPAFAGSFAATFTLNVSDEDIPGASVGVPLTLNVLAEVVGGGLAGDLNADGLVDQADIDTLFAAVNAGSTDPLFDLDGDGGAADQDDVSELVRGILGTEFGDVNLDRQITIGDLSQIGTNLGVSGGLGYADGDLTGDDRVTIGDLSLAGSNFGFDATGAAVAAPEPATLTLLTIGVMAAASRRR